MKTAETEAELVRRWRCGNTAAGDILVRQHYGSVLRFFEYRAGPLAEDLVQRTFAACADGLDTYRAEGTFKAFVFGIARLQLLRHQRERHRTDATSEFDDSAAPDRLTSLSTLVSRHEEQRVLLQSLVSLPPHLQTVLVLHYWEGMKAKDIAEVCESTTSTITTRLVRARELLRGAVETLARTGKTKDSLLSDPEGWLNSVAAKATPDDARGGASTT